MSDLAATLLGFARDAEASYLVLGEDLEMIYIWTELAYVRLVQDEEMEREHGTVWGSIRNTVELSQKRDEEVTVTTLKTQVYKIEPLTKKMESEIWASIIQIKDLTYAFSQLCQKIGHLYNLENERSGREEESSFGNPQCIGRSQDKGDNPTHVLIAGLAEKLS